MPNLKFNILSSKNSGLVISASELIERYFFGIPLITSQGQAISEDTIRYHIRTSQESLEHYLSVKINRQVIEEDRDFIREEFENWSYVRTTYLVAKATALKGFISDVQQVAYPQEWLSTRKTSDDRLYYRHIYLVPGSNTAKTNSVVYSGISPHLGFFGSRQIPQYWKTQYITGFKKVPIELVSFIGKHAAISIFAILGDFILPSGIASQSLSIDGLSQSFTTTRSGKTSIFGSRIDLYQQSLATELKELDGFYRGIGFIGA